jgi:malonyl-CoA O-methyltransferase
MLFLNKIIKNFDQASLSYDTVADIQKKSAQFLTNQIDEKGSEDYPLILDVGTGTGYMPELLLPLYPNSHYYLNDVSSQMLSVCEKKFHAHPNIHFLHSDMNTVTCQPCHLITSNFSLQWCEKIYSSIEFLYNFCHDTLAFSLLLDGTFQEWNTLINLDSPLNYPKLNHIKEFCENQKNLKSFHYWTIDYPLFFENPLVFMHYLKSLGAMTSKHTLNIHQLKKSIKRNAPLTVCYKVFFAILKKQNDFN